MDSTLGKRISLALGGLLVLTLGAGTMKANVLSPITAATVTCNTATGPGTAATVTVKAATAPSGSATDVVTLGTITGALQVTPTSQTLTSSNNSAGVSFTVNAPNGCVSALASSSIPFLVNNAADASVAVTDTVTTAAASGLVASPTAVTVQCTLSSGTYTPGLAQTVSVTSAASGGIPFTITSSGQNNYASWLSLSSNAGGTASSTPVTFTAVAASGCGSYAVNSTHTTTVHLAATGGGPDLLLVVTIQIQPGSPLTVTPVPAAPSISMTYVKGSGVPAVANVSVSSSIPSAFFTVNAASLPIWLTVSASSGTATAPLSFSTTSVTDSLAPGTYTATVLLQVSGYGPSSVPITLLVTNKPPKLSVNSATIPISWTIGSAIPTTTIVVSSSDSPIAYTITTGGTLAPSVAADETSGLAYSFGTEVPVTFNPTVFATATPGSVITGTITFSWGNPVAVTIVTINVTVASPGATLTGLSPASLPTAASGTTFPVVITGTGFVGGTDPTLKTRVGVVVGGQVVADTNFSVNVVNASNIILTITVPTTTDAYLPFSPTGAGGSVAIGLCNGTCTTPTGTATLNIGVGPIIQGVTSASSFNELVTPTLAPYDMISIFGVDFCSSGGTGCSSTQILSNAPSASTQQYIATLSPDAVSSTQRLLTVTFYPHGNTTAIATAPLLFATNNQINAIVPAAVSTYTANGVDIVVSFGYGSGATLLKSAAFHANIAAADPGVFTIGQDGEGSGAALSATYSLISGTNPAGMRTGAHAGADSDTILLYVTGLGLPTSTAANTAGSDNPPVAPTDCIAATGSGSYEASLASASGATLSNIDGALIQTSLLATNRLPPCLATEPTVYIGGVAGTVTYAGFVSGAVAGLYQINVQLPASTGATLYPNYPLTSSPINTITAPVQLPVQVKVGNITSQNNVTIWVAPRLLMVGPTGSALNATIGTAYSGQVTAYEGTGTISYVLQSGVLPSGLTLSPATGLISGTALAGTAGSYQVTIGATDSASPAVTGSLTFTIVVSGVLTVTDSGTSPFAAAYGTSSPSLTTISVSGGTAPYTFAITTPSTNPAGMSVNQYGVVSTLPSTPAGVYNVVVTVTDSSSTPLTATVSFTIDVALDMTTTIAPTTQSAADSTGVLAEVTATGNTGTVTYALDSTSATAGLAIDSNGNITVGSAPDATYSVTVTATDGGTAPGATGNVTGTSTISVTIAN
jgi:uncharacterized protein (TIGR03437 family)